MTIADVRGMDAHFTALADQVQNEIREALTRANKGQRPEANRAHADRLRLDMHAARMLSVFHRRKRVPTALQYVRTLNHVHDLANPDNDGEPAKTLRQFLQYGWAAWSMIEGEGGNGHAGIQGGTQVQRPEEVEATPGDV